MQNSEKSPKTGKSENGQGNSAGFSYKDLELSIPEMLKAGLHFGHKSSRWNPRMKSYIFGIKNGIHIIDLEKTQAMFQSALDFLKNVVEHGGKILFIGTKPQVRQLVEEAAELLEMPYVKNRWLGGTFTNFGEIKRRIKHLNEQEALVQGDQIKKYTKYEQSRIKKEIERMNEKMGGIKKMEKLPQTVFIIDIKENALVVKEARSAGIPTVAIADTNTDPTLVDYAIPANDDALSSLRYIFGILARDIQEAKKKVKSESKTEEKNK